MTEKDDILNQDFVKTAVNIQDASNIVAVTHELMNAMKKSRLLDNDPRKNDAVISIFFKLYDMLGAPSEKEMYDALLRCEKCVEE